MKNAIAKLLLAVSFLWLSSCGINHALIVNDNQISTQVQLNTNNFEDVQKVKGSAEVEYTLTIGGCIVHNFMKMHMQTCSPMQN